MLGVARRTVITGPGGGQAAGSLDGRWPVAGPLLETKLHLPRRRRESVSRPRLAELLSRGAESRLTLVSGPAGFGKSTLLADWLATAENPAAWLSLDERDNDPAVFWTYLITALRTAAPGVGSGALAVLQSPQPPIEAVLSTLLNDLSALPDDVVLVLDDYHVIEGREVQDGMAFLLDHLPGQIHLMIAARSDPALPLGRLRARGELTEIRAAELRFTPEEAASYLNQTMHLGLTAADVAALEGRTEGWIAALQLAALSLRGRGDIAAFIAGFAGDDRYIVDYLVEEVLQRQPDQVHDFLLRTSILDRLSGPLCDAVTGRDGGRATLAALERGNLFLIALDDRRQWFRYHQLFADVLQARLADEHPDDLPDLHRRASRWYEQHDEPTNAVRHALAANDFERAADLVELALPAMRRSRQETTMRSWLRLLPDEVVRARPVLNVGFAGTLLAFGELEGVEGRLQDAERWLSDPGARAAESGAGTGQMIVGDEVEYRRLPGTIELFRAAQSLARGDMAGTVLHAGRAIELSPDDDHLSRAAAAGLLGLAYWGAGDLEAGHAAYAACMAGLYQAGHVADTFGCALALADIRCAQGRLDDARRTYERALLRAAEHAGPVLRGTADMYVGLSELHREHDDLPAARAQVLQSQAVGEHNGLPQHPYRLRVARARILQAEGDLAGALDLLDEAERVYVGDFFPPVRPVPAVRARVWIGSGRWRDALDWAAGRALCFDDDLSYLREYEHITLARALLASAQARDADAERSMSEVTLLLERLRQAAADGGRTGSVIEVVVLQALVHQTRGNLEAAVATLEKALTLSESEGYVRLYLDEGPALAALLRAASKSGIAPGYVRRLLAAFAMDAEGQPGQPGAVDPLSARELDVLRLLGTDLEGPEIARALYVTLNTLRTHTRNIYAKLGVNNRRTAVRKAGELGLLSPPPGR